MVISEVCLDLPAELSVTDSTVTVRGMGVRDPGALLLLLGHKTEKLRNVLSD